MAAVLVGAGSYSLLATGPVGWAAFAAGTMIVSGLMARKAEIDGNKDAAQGWLAVGTVASLGASFSSTPGVEGGASQAEMLAAQDAGLSALPSAPAIESGATVEGMTAAQNAGMGVQPAATEVAKKSGEMSMAEHFARYEAKAAEIAQRNLIVQTTAGLATAGVAWQSNEEQAKIKREQLAEERRLSDRQYANTNNLVGLNVQTPQNLPNLLGGARKAGLINATATQVQ